MRRQLAYLAVIVFLTLCPGLFALATHRLEPSEQIVVFLLITCYVYIVQFNVGYLLTISRERSRMLNQASTGEIFLQDYGHHLRKFDKLTNGTTFFMFITLALFWLGSALNTEIAYVSVSAGIGTGIFAFIAFNWQSKINLDLVLNRE